MMISMELLEKKSAMVRWNQQRLKTARDKAEREAIAAELSFWQSL